MYPYVIFLVLITCCCTLKAQNQIGTDIPWMGENDEFGSGMAISEDGNIVAIGAHRWNLQQGIVHVYKNVQGQWSLAGDPIPGPVDDGWFGTSISLTPSGKRMAVGSYYNPVVNIYDFNGYQWKLTGKVIAPIMNRYLHYGYAIDLSEDGAIIAISMTHYPEQHIHTGIVYIFQETPSQWKLLGNPIEGEAEKDESGWDLDLTQDGHTISISSLRFKDEDEPPGHVRTFTFDGNDWQPSMTTVEGKSIPDGFGWKLDVSEDGKYMIVGAPYDYTGAAPHLHYAVVYEAVHNTWVQKGQTIYGLPDETFGYDVAITEDGNRIAVSIPGHKTCPIRIYDFENGRWELVGSVTHDAEYHALGISIAMNPSGTVVTGASWGGHSFGVVYSLEDLTIPACDIVEEEDTTSTIANMMYFPNLISAYAAHDLNAVFYGQSSIPLSYHLEIYDRWGNQLFLRRDAMTNNIADGWAPGSAVLPGVYVFRVIYHNGEKEEVVTGDVTVVR